MEIPAPPHANSYWAVPGQLLAGEYPGSSVDADARTRLSGLLDCGVRSFIDLTERGELRPYAAILEEEARSRGIQVAHERFAIRDLGVPREPVQMAAILDAIEAALRDQRLAYVHCWGGVGRTGVVVGCLLVRHGLTGDEALAELARLWSGVAKAPRKPDSPETEQQRHYVRAWREVERSR